MTDKAKAEQETREENLEQAAAPSDEAAVEKNQELEDLKAAIDAGDFDINEFLSQYKEALAAKDEAEARACLLYTSTMGGWRLPGATLYVTLEPCPMCAGALVNARVERLVFGAYDPKAGAAGSVLDIVRCSGLNHQLEVTGGVLAEESAALLKNFFARKRR